MNDTREHIASARINAERMLPAGTERETDLAEAELPDHRLRRLLGRQKDARMSFPRRHGGRKTRQSRIRRVARQHLRSDFLRAFETVDRSVGGDIVARIADVVDRLRLRDTVRLKLLRVHHPIRRVPRQHHRHGTEERNDAKTEQGPPGAPDAPKRPESLDHQWGDEFHFREKSIRGSMTM